MRNLAVSHCISSHPWPPPSGHPFQASVGTILVVLLVATYCIMIARRVAKAKAKAKADTDRRELLDGESVISQRETFENPAQNPKEETQPPELYKILQPYAKSTKAALQMFIGAVAVFVVMWQYFNHPDVEDPTKLFLNGIGVALAAAAAIELAYTLFTDGPDEALDPLLLGIASTLTLRLAGLKDTPSWSSMGVLAVLALLLVSLFAARLMLIESEQQPKLWWITRLSARWARTALPLPPERDLRAEHDTARRSNESTVQSN